MKSGTVDKILQETEAGYDSIAEKFSATRDHFWPELAFIKDYAQAGDKVLDFGCGNGRLLDILAAENIAYFGVDASQKLIELARSKYAGEKISFQKIAAGQTSLPFPDNYFNTAYSVAVFHHFPVAQAEKIAQELRRIVKPGGYVIVTVWNLWPASHRRAVFASRGGQNKYLKNILKNWLQKMLGRSELDWNDCHIPFQNNQGEKFSRYHHAWTKGELRSLFAAAGWRVERCLLIEGKNWLLVGRK